MLEVSWFAFYLLVHLLLALGVLPMLLWLGRHLLQPQWMLRLWTMSALIVVILPLLLLQPWAFGRQVLPWFHGGIQYFSSSPILTHAKQGNDLAVVQIDPQIVSPEKLQSQGVKQIRWPVLSQWLYRLAPVIWLWLLVPIGVCWQLVRLINSYFATRRIRQQALMVTAFSNSSVVSILKNTCPLVLCVHPKVPSAMLLGFRQPMIVLPQSYLEQCSLDELKLIVDHELEHYRQQDLRVYVVQQLVGCFFWWSPAWRVIVKELDRWREIRCDWRVSKGLPDPVGYAQTLLDCAKRLSVAGATPFQALAQRWLQPSLLALRIDAVLSCQQQPRLWHVRTMCLFLFCFCAAGFWLAQRFQLADLPAQHAQIRLSQLAPLASLLKAVSANNSAEVVRLLGQGAPLNLAMPGQGSALMVAVKHGYRDLVALLLTHGADVEVSSRGDGNALIIAASRGDLVLVKRLLDAGANVNAAVLADETALINASFRNDIAMVQLLLDHGADINLQVETPLADGPEMRSALSRAASPAMQAYLIARGAR